MMIFVVIDPLKWHEFKLFSSVEDAVASLEKEGYTLAASRDIKVSPRVRLVYTKGKEERLVFCRSLET